METNQGREPIAERLKQQVESLAGVPARLVPLLHRVGLYTARDVLFCFPRGYEDLTRICAIREIDGSGPVSVCGVVDEVESRTLSAGRSVTGTLIRDDSGSSACGLVQSAVHAAASCVRAACDAVRACRSGAGCAGRCRIRAW